MTTPAVTNVSPAPNQIGVVLGQPIVITFNVLMDHSTLDESSFSVACPGSAQILTPSQYISSNPSTLQAIGYVDGTYSYDDTSGATVFTFNPKEPLKPNSTYQLLLVGGDGIIVSDYAKGADGTPLPNSYSWSFQTGNLNLLVPPTISPLPPNNPAIDPNEIRILLNPRGHVVGNDLSQEIDIVFPAPIDPDFDLSTLLLSIDPVIGDPSVTVPPNLVTHAVLGTGANANRIMITITGW